LSATSRALNEQASQLVAAQGASVTCTNVSSAGAANVSAAIASFCAAYARRLANRGQSAQAAAANYTIADDGVGRDIASASV
jgi:hypothetical protein